MEIEGGDSAVGSMNSTEGVMKYHDEVIMNMWTDSQQRAIAIAAKVTGPMSMVGSLLIIREIFLRKKLRQRMQHRLLLGMSLADLISSFWMFLSNWAIPVGTPNTWDPRGTRGSCVAQGFFIQLAVAAPLYNASLGLFYFLIGARNWSAKMTSRVEVILHGIPCTFALGTAIAGLPLQLFNPSVVWCWIGEYPRGCTMDGICERGNHAWIYQWAFFFGPLWLVAIMATFCMISVFAAVRKREKLVDEVQPEGIVLRTQSRRVAARSFWYLMAFYATWMPITIYCALHVWHIESFPLTFLVALLTPSQGVFNFLVLRGPKVRIHRVSEYAPDFLQTNSNSPGGRSRDSFGSMPHDKPKDPQKHSQNSQSDETGVSGGTKCHGSSQCGRLD